MTTEQQVAVWKQELVDLRCGWEFAFANGARCNGGRGNPALQAVLAREGELHALIAEHSP